MELFFQAPKKPIIDLDTRKKPRTCKCSTNSMERKRLKVKKNTAMPSYWRQILHKKDDTTEAYNWKR